MMNRKLFLILFLNIVVSFGLSSAAAAQQIPSASLLDPQTAEKANAHEDELYQSAKDALDNGEYDQAIR
jgi:outer membrane protein assembly factor BamD (BamD/ComL family)